MAIFFLIINLQLESSIIGAPIVSWIYFMRFIFLSVRAPTKQTQLVQYLYFKCELKILFKKTI
ncbi:MAG: hypothetical protein CFE25_13440 [Chitinophagaceae bacterium BSSC1]|nr:MAG: hypothetical protein CFE25_13440 [Chitinophagaceae bacterium BSSC1]